METFNLLFAWVWILAGMLSGAVSGLFFYRADWLGGYGSWRRRMLRLGHVAFFGTGFLNLGFAWTIGRLGEDADQSTMLAAASVLLIVGAVTMPAVCFASAWREGLRHLFFVPVLSLVAAVAILLAEGLLP